jgi:hypothetical protein
VSNKSFPKRVKNSSTNLEISNAIVSKENNNKTNPILAKHSCNTTIFAKEEYTLRRKSSAPSIRMKKK